VPVAARVVARRGRAVAEAAAGITSGAEAATGAAVATVVVGARARALVTADAASLDRAPAIVTAVTAAAAIVARPLAVDVVDLVRPCPTGSATRETAMRRRKAPVSASSISPTIRERKTWKRSLEDMGRLAVSTSFMTVRQEEAVGLRLSISSTWTMRKRREIVVPGWKSTGVGFAWIIRSPRGLTRRPRECTWDVLCADLQRGYGGFLTSCLFLFSDVMCSRSLMYGFL